jgi:hypothetical protein
MKRWQSNFCGDMMLLQVLLAIMAGHFSLVLQNMSVRER